MVLAALRQNSGSPPTESEIETLLKYTLAHDDNLENAMYFYAAENKAVWAGEETKVKIII